MIRLGDVFVNKHSGLVLPHEDTCVDSMTESPEILITAMQVLADKRGRFSQDPLWKSIARLRASIPGLKSCKESYMDRQTQMQEMTDDCQYPDARVIVHSGRLASVTSRAEVFTKQDEPDQFFVAQSCDREILKAMLGLPSIVILGIIDVCHAQEGEGWHEYAAATATAYARELFICASEAQHAM